MPIQKSNNDVPNRFGRQRSIDQPIAILAMTEKPGNQAKVPRTQPISIGALPSLPLNYRLCFTLSINHPSSRVVALKMLAGLN